MKHNSCVDSRVDWKRGISVPASARRLKNKAETSSGQTRIFRNDQKLIYQLPWLLTKHISELLIDQLAYFTSTAVLWQTLRTSSVFCLHRFSLLRLPQLKKTLCRWPRWRILCWGTCSGATRSGCGPSSTPTTPSPCALDSRSRSWLTWWEKKQGTTFVKCIQTSTDMDVVQRSLIGTPPSHWYAAGGLTLHF